MKLKYTKVGYFFYRLPRSIKAIFIGWRFPFLKPYIDFTGNKIWKLENIKEKSLKNKIILSILYTLQRIWPVPYTFWDNIPKGWRKAFGWQMCKELQKYSNKGYRWLDFKEKFGMIRIEDACSNTMVNKIIHKYEYISSFTCIKCGKIADGHTTCWISPYCVSCKPEHDFFVHFGYNKLPFYGWTGNINNVENWDELCKEYDEYYA